MTTLDRYIARQFVVNTVVLLVLLFTFVIAVDVALNLDRYVNRADVVMRQAAGAAAGAAKPSAVRTGVVTAWLVVDLWWPRLLQLFNFMLGLVLAGAMGFTVTQLVRHRELVAVLASGVSLWRAARPIMLVAIGATLLQALNQELVIPRLAERGLLARDYRTAGDHEAPPFEVRFLSDPKGNRYYATRFEAATGTLEHLHVWERDAQGRFARRISATKGVWHEGDRSRSGYWELENATIQPLGLAEVGSPAEPAASGELAAAAAGSRVQLASEMDPQQLLLRRYASFSQSLSWGEISQVLRSGRVDAGMRDQLERVRWGRVSLMIANLLSLAINLPFFLTREPKNMVVQSLKCAPVGLVSMMGSVVAMAVIWPGLPAAFAVFVPVLVLIPIAIAVLSAMKT